MKNSRKKTVIECIECGEVILGGSHMSRHVQKKHGYNSYDEYKITHKLIKTKETLIDQGAVCCKICELVSHDLTSHIIRTHKISVNTYKNLYGGEIRSTKYRSEQSERIKGNKNPAYNHEGKYSPFSEKFIYADTIDKKELCQKVSESNKNNGNNSTTVKYWLKRGYSLEESIKQISIRQTTFSLNHCIQKYGEENGRKRWLKRQEKWIESHKKSRKNKFSKISQEMFWEIYNIIKLDKNFIFFAELDSDKKMDLSGINHEYKLNLPERILLPDFINIKTKKIIEFDGTYWHNEYIIKSTNRLRDFERDQILMSNGFKVLHIKEEKYRKDKENIIKKCLEFLNG
jgi:hypothetical protein